MKESHRLKSQADRSRKSNRHMLGWRGHLFPLFSQITLLSSWTRKTLQDKKQAKKIYWCNSSNITLKIRFHVSECKYKETWHAPPHFKTQLVKQHFEISCLTSQVSYSIGFLLSLLRNVQWSKYQGPGLNPGKFFDLSGCRQITYLSILVL